MGAAAVFVSARWPQQEQRFEGDVPLPKVSQQGAAEPPELPCDEDSAEAAQQLASFSQVLRASPLPSFRDPMLYCCLSNEAQQCVCKRLKECDRCLQTNSENELLKLP